MTDPTFSEALLAVSVNPSRDTAFRDISAITATKQAVQGLLGDAPGSLPNPESIAKVVRRFRQRETLTDREVIICAAGAGFPIDDHRILESDVETRRLLELTGSERSRTSGSLRARRTFLALARSYFEWAPTDRASEETPWSGLRADLATRIEAIAEHSESEAWQDRYDHRNVFTTDPCGRYAGLGVDSDMIRHVSELFSIPDDSWFLDELFRAGVAAICAENDAIFRDRLDDIVQQLDGRPLETIEWALARLLDRYADASFSSTERTDLSDLAVELWATPRDTANWPRWSHVRDDTREMVAQWLVGKIVKDVFDVFGRLAPDSKARERSDYWIQWKDQIRDIWILAGTNRKSEFSAVKGLVGESSFRFLSGRNNSRSDVSALLMYIGDYAFVELSHSGHGLYVYEIGGHEYGDLPFDLRNRDRFEWSPVVSESQRNNGRQIKDQANSKKVLGKSGDRMIPKWRHVGPWDARGGDFDQRMARYLDLRRS